MTNLRQAAKAVVERWDSPKFVQGPTANLMADLRKALEQPEQEPTQWRDMVVVSLVREGINKHKARELADHFATPPAAAQPEQTFYQPAANEAVEILKSIGYVYEPTYTGLAWVAKKSAQPEQEPVAYGMWDTMIGYGGRMMMVRLDKGQDGCTVPLYTTPPPCPTCEALARTVMLDQTGRDA